MTSAPQPVDGEPFDPHDPPLWAPRYGCSLSTAVRRFFRKYADFTGRASRSEYWLMQLAMGVCVTPLVVLAALPEKSTGVYVGVGVVAVLCLLAIVVPILTVTVRRLHDANLSGFFVLFGFIPYVGWLIMMVPCLAPPNPKGARFDDPWYRITRDGYSSDQVMDPTQQ